MSHRKRKSDDDVEWRKKKTKRKSKDVESVFFFFYHSFTNSIRSWQCYQFGRCKRYTLEKIGEFT